MGKVYTREELEGIRDRVLIQAKAFYESQGRMPSIRELLDITGVTQHAIYKVFGGKAGIEDALNEGSTREEELPKTHLREKPFRHETYAQEQKAETLAMVPGIDLSRYAHCTRLGDRHGL